MHAAVRHLAPTSPAWRPDSGLPVNQEDLAGTLMAFSWIALDGLDKLGYRLTDDERAAYLHSWLVVGHLLEACLPLLFFAELPSRLAHRDSESIDPADRYRR